MYLVIDSSSDFRFGLFLTHEEADAKLTEVKSTLRPEFDSNLEIVELLE